MAPLTHQEEELYHSSVPEWQINRSGIHQIQREFTLKDFREALSFVNQIGEIAEQEGHHPNIELFDYKKVRIKLYTHAIGGLSMNDFILAAKIDSLRA